MELTLERLGRRLLAKNHVAPDHRSVFDVLASSYHHAVGQNTSRNASTFLNPNAIPENRPIDFGILSNFAPATEVDAFPPGSHKLEANVQISRDC
jgi:hypothetical protein